MENGGAKTNGVAKNWRFNGKEGGINNGNGSMASHNKNNNNNTTSKSRGVTVREARNMIMENLNPDDERPMLALAHGDPSIFPCFRTCPNAERAVVDALCSGNFNSYGTAVGILPARKYVHLIFYFILLFVVYIHVTIKIKILYFIFAVYGMSFILHMTFK